MQITQYLYWIPTTLCKEGGYLTIYDNRLADSHTRKYLCELVLDVPQFDKREALIECLKAEKAVLIKQATEKAEEIDEKIQQLLALPQDKNE